MIVGITSGGVTVAALADRRSVVGLEVVDRGDRSAERRGFCKGEAESDSDLVTPLLGLLTFGVAGDALRGVADKVDLSSAKSHKYRAVLRIP